MGLFDQFYPLAGKNHMMVLNQNNISTTAVTDTVVVSMCWVTQILISNHFLNHFYCTLRLFREAHIRYNVSYH